MKNFNNSKFGFRKRLPLRLSEEGWTLIELMTVLALMAIIIPAVTLLFMKVQSAFASDEMHMQLKTADEKAQLRIHERLLQSKHMFQNDTYGKAFLAAAQLSASAPKTLAGSVLPVAQPSTITSFSPKVGSITGDFGNQLFFAAFDFPQTVRAAGKPASIFTAPLNIYGSGVTFSNTNGGGPATVILDVYRFYYYYLGTNDMTIPSVATYRLVEWESIQYADAAELGAISDSSVLSGVINWLTSTSPINFKGGPISFAYDPSQSQAVSAFYTLSSGQMNSTNTATISEAQYTFVSQVNTGMLTGGFNYGVCGNNAGWTKSPPIQVPLYAPVNGAFPGGFEVGIMGGGSGMQVMTRCIMVAQGATPKVSWYDNTGITGIRDLW